MLEFIKNIDISIIDYIYNYIQSPFLNKIMIPISTIGNGGFIWIIIILILLRTKKHRKMGLAATCALLLSAILGLLILKPLIQRPRPFVELSYIHLLIHAPSSYSFPSGHTITAFSTAITLVKMIKNKIFAIPIMLLAIFIGFSRIYLTVHYPSDVLAGIILGFICSNTVLFLLEKNIWNRQKTSTNE
ncbi:phosphatase PAP2 family protein [Crassaminicella profunda]|uniref:phosphatase PAP2 family protein n=1 Tax=Crassaminicella profunda TaxID=1286698 RepID=UPI001CA61B77|nr:phosphatase PAP2 family protein [Crassaminicella profunda]QZY53680.1 phosphatase PAP2 family protein [Crassaminicella profunda]